MEVIDTLKIILQLQVMFVSMTAVHTWWREVYHGLIHLYWDVCIKLMQKKKEAQIVLFFANKQQNKWTFTKDIKTSWLTVIHRLIITCQSEKFKAWH